MAGSGLRIGVIGIGARSPLAALANTSVVLTRLVAAADTAPDAVERAVRMLPSAITSLRPGSVRLEAPVLDDDLVAYVTAGKREPD